MRQVERSIFDLRRGLPVLIRNSDPQTDDSHRATLVAPLEGMTDAALQRLAEHAGNPCALIVTKHRLEVLGLNTDGDAAALPITADNTATQVIDWACARHPQTQPEPKAIQKTTGGDAAGLTLMRRGLLIPAAITAPVAADRLAAIEARVKDGSLLATDTDAVANYENNAPNFLKRISAADVPLDDAPRSRFVLFREADGMREHLAIVIGDPEKWADAVPVRLHSACLTGDLFGSLRCDCGEQLRSSVAKIADHGGGVLLYLAQEGRGIGLANKLRAYSLQDEGLDTVDADHVLGFGDDERRYNVALEMLAQLEIRQIELLTNNPSKIAAMSRGGVTVVQRSGVYGRVTHQNRRYLTAKATRAGHWLDQVLGTSPEDATATDN
ncbi:Bifunctional riboflavin biosynthesis protein RibAB [Salinisphaera shabanensis E1L3A]|uniref:GTP cyclohydrolase-2 n=1 Tax=Salinisphaera shabanensis E1L3A TaxID=1033802 RepID=U2EHT9_9GAMM|nr:GTP cyclohydrolase II RibA [Salinisphaera shabanensis]ERJ17937.1 Bifunctional riboflavin biosynthesis protein RibAB [Salinisphaera shabanensis E1L3A]